jgi:hypothetical protein
MSDSREKTAAKLYSAARIYHQRGWSVIPIYGDSDPQRPKAAAVAWTVYQQRQPTLAELETWFLTQHYQGLAIVCGPASHLAVLDFDDAGCAAAFVRMLPDLAQTYCVRSGGRGLPHYYFQAPEGLSVRTKRTPQADFQAQGAYVVAPPTLIAGAAWQVTDGRDLLALTPQAVSRITAFLDLYAYQRSGALQAALDQAAHLRQVIGLVEPDPVLITDDYVRGLYRYLAPRLGRNEALFRAACFARDCGWTETAISAALVETHIVQPPPPGHAPETPAARRAEACRTIRSVLRCKPGVPRLVSFRNGLPGTVREALLKLKQCGVARVLDGLLLLGIKAGERVTERVACGLLAVFRIGRRTVQTALKALLPTGQTVFASAAPPAPPPEKTAGAAEGSNKRKQCSFVRGADRVKTPEGGRPARWYQVPTLAGLCRALGVPLSGGDALTAADLRSPTAYRCALHRLLIQRRPGAYGRGWLAARLGVSVWTSRRYDRAAGLDVQPQYDIQRVTWSNLAWLPLEDSRAEADGRFLETDEGRCYPPVRGLAARLLGQQRAVWLRQQRQNRYASADERPRAAALMPVPAAKTAPAYREIIHKSTANPNPARAAAAESGPAAEPARQLWLCPHCLKWVLQVEKPNKCSKCALGEWELIPETIWRDPEQCKAWWGPLYRAHHERQRQQQRAALAPRPAPPEPARLDPEAEKTAERLYTAVQRRTPQHALTHSAARELVRVYGVAAVEDALRLLRDRAALRNAAGFVITALRSQHPARKPAPAPRAAAPEQHAAWLERFRQSAYAAYIDNASDE